MSTDAERESGGSASGPGAAGHDQRVARVDELVEGALLRVERGGRVIGVCRHDGRLAAFDARCPHMHADLTEGLLHDGGVACPHHLWHFDLASGECTMVPGYRIDVFEVREEDGWVVLRAPA